MAPTFKGLQPKSQIFILPKCVGDAELQLCEFPHPSNNTSKQPIRVFIHDNIVYQLETKSFSRGCPYNREQDEIHERYHYTADGKAYKSAIHLDKENPHKSVVLESGDFDYHSKYDLAYSLCRFYYRADVVDSEEAYLKEDTCIPIKSDSNFLSLRDFHDTLIDNDGPHWSHVPPQVLEQALKKVCETVEEGNEIYYKITAEMISHWLALRIPRIVAVFPSSLPLPKDIPEEYIRDAKVCWAVNLLLSLLPRTAYWSLRRYAGPDIDIRQAYERLQRYKEEVIEKDKENEILVKAAMSVGIASSGDAPATQVAKPSSAPKARAQPNKRKVAIGKGAIDGFFRKR